MNLFDIFRCKNRWKRLHWQRVVCENIYGITKTPRIRVSSYGLIGRHCVSNLSLSVMNAIAMLCRSINKILNLVFLHFRFRKIEINLEVIFLGLIEQYFLSYYIPKTLCYWCGKHVIKVKIDFAIVCESFRTLTSPLLFSNIYKLCILLYNDVPGH